MSLVADVDIREMVTSLFQPDVLLPAQCFERMKRTDVRPEKALMLAVLEDAVCCFQKYCLASDRKGRILFKEAESWIFDGDDSGVFAYRNVCDVLDIDGDYLRHGLLRWKESICHFAQRRGFIRSKSNFMYGKYGESKEATTIDRAAKKIIDRVSVERHPHGIAV